MELKPGMYLLGSEIIGVHTTNGRIFDKLEIKTENGKFISIVPDGKELRIFDSETILYDSR